MLWHIRSIWGLPLLVVLRCCSRIHEHDRFQRCLRSRIYLYYGWGYSFECSFGAGYTYQLTLCFFVWSSWVIFVVAMLSCLIIVSCILRFRVEDGAFLSSFVQLPREVWWSSRHDMWEGYFLPHQCVLKSISSHATWSLVVATWLPVLAVFVGALWKNICFYLSLSLIQISAFHFHSLTPNYSFLVQNYSFLAQNFHILFVWFYFGVIDILMSIIHIFLS